MDGTKIAIIEDDKILSNALYAGLKEAGFEVAQAFDGEEGLALVQSQKPDLVLLNILLPKVDGLKVAKQLKGAPETKSIPIIILTVLEKSSSVAEALESGVFEYLVKSDYKVEDIIKMVKEKLRKQS